MKTRVTQVTREDGIDALEWNDEQGWVMRDRRGPVRFYNFATEEWEVIHVFDTSTPEFRGCFVFDKDFVLAKLETVERPQ